MGTATSLDNVGARVAQRLAEAVGPRKYAMWFDRSARFDYDAAGDAPGGTLRVSVPNRFAADWIDRNFDEVLRAAAGEAVGRDVVVELCVEPEHFTAAPPPEAASAEAAAPKGGAMPTDLADAPQRVAARRPRLASLRHDLDSFVVGPSNRLAHAAALRIADEASDAAHPLFLHGGCGLGKTHLLQGACAALLRRRPDARVLYTTGEQFTNDYITAVRTNKIEAFRRRIRQLELLAVDDVHFIANKQATQQEFLHSFDTIELGGARVILASDCHPKLIRQFSEALISRCVRGLVVQIERPDPETRLRLVEALAERRGMRLQEGVAEALAEECDGSVREIEGLLTKLLALASLTRPGGGFVPGQTVVGHALVRQLFSSDFSTVRPRKPVRFDAILKGVAAYLGVTPQQVIGRGRHKQIVLARGMTIHLARQMTAMSYPEIAAAMDRSNHSTVITAAQRIERMLQADEPMLLPTVGADGEPANLRPSELVARLKQAVTA